MSEALQNVLVEKCRPSPTARAVLPIKVEELARSIEQIGLRQPISVRRVDEGFEVRGGGHRLAAFARLGREWIPAFVREDDDLHAELAEIDENLIRNELGPAERASAVARRKAIYEELHPETQHGSPGVSRQVGDTRERAGKERFTKQTADATGSSERTVQREAERGEKIGQEALGRVAGTSLDKGEELDALAKLSQDKRETLIDRAAKGDKVSAKVELKKDQREGKEIALAHKQRALPRKRYGLLYVDIPRHFNVRSDETGLGRSPENHYPTMSFDDLLNLPIDTIAADDSILVFWSTGASVFDDIEIMAEWGFAALRPRTGLGKLSKPNGIALPPVGAGKYKSMQVWDKVRMGLGYWFRDRHEFILIGVRGNVVPPAPGTQDESLFSEPKGEHSAKPARVAEMIDRLWPNIPKIELFARTTRPGWDVWGLEAPDQESEAAASTAGIAIQGRPETENTSAQASPEPGDAGEVQDRCESTSPPISGPEEIKALALNAPDTLLAKAAALASKRTLAPVDQVTAPEPQEAAEEPPVVAPQITAPRPLVESFDPETGEILRAGGFVDNRGHMVDDIPAFLRREESAS